MAIKKTILKETIKPDSVLLCEKCQIEMIITGFGPRFSTDYQCPNCKTKTTKGGN